MGYAVVGYFAEETDGKIRTLWDGVAKSIEFRWLYFHSANKIEEYKLV